MSKAVKQHNDGSGDHNVGTAEQEEIKLHWFPLEAKDWLTDSRLSLCSPTTRGIWIDAICVMWLNGQSGELTGTAAQLARMCRCSEPEMREALIELFETGTADILLPSKNEANRFCLLSKTQANGTEILQANLQANLKQILRNRRMYKAHGISQIRSEVGRKGGSKTQANGLAKMKQVHQANRQANGKQSSSKRSDSDSESGSGSGSGFGNGCESVSHGNQEDNGQSPVPGNGLGQVALDQDQDEEEIIEGIPS